MVNSEPDPGLIETMPMVGGDLSLDFVNTASQRREGPLRDRLRTYADLVEWGERSGAIEAGAGQRLRTTGAEQRAAAAAVLERGRALREALYELFGGSVPAGGEQPSALDVLNHELQRASSQREVSAADGAFAWSWSAELPLDRILAVVAVSAADLLTSPDSERVKECGGSNCNWLFRDTSRNRSRRWCDMKDCGNRAKAKRYYARHRHEPE
jgi:predicted RNA-binding Zn ribbon-like protein